MIKDTVLFQDKFIVRSPSLPFNMEFTKETIFALLRDKAFLEAIYIASPDLYNECLNLMLYPDSKDEKKQRKLIVSLTKYYVRMSTRCTPFGLFSGCSLAEWSKTGQEIKVAKAFSRKTRLDMHFLCNLSEHVERMPEVKYSLVYFPNSSLYNPGDTFRYIEYEYINGYRSYRISSVEATDYLVKLVKDSKAGLSYKELLHKIQSGTGASENDARVFLDEVISSQVFVSELEPVITASDFSELLLGKLKMLLIRLPDCEELRQVYKILHKAIGLLNELDREVTSGIAAYKEIVEELKLLGISFEERKLFQVDLVTGDGIKTCLPGSIQEQLKEAIDLCSMLTEEPSIITLTNFRKKFRTRYENAEKPLLEVLDVECGIGFGDYEVQDNSGDFEDVYFGSKAINDSINWTGRTKYLFEKLSEARKRNALQIELDLEEIKAIKAPSEFRMPPSMSVIFRRYLDQHGSERIVFENCVGVSGISLMARFAHADPAIGKLCREIASAEQELNSGIRFAEIVHLPERRVGNILLHPVFREFEIPYLAQSSIEEEARILPENLLVSVSGERVILRDRISGREIIPRLSSAHNFNRESLPVYQFLASLQSQALNLTAGFNWGELSNLFQFYPRVTYKNAILSLATWKLTDKDLRPLIEASEMEQMERMQEFIGKWDLPQAFVVSEGDNEMLIYASNRLSVLTFLDIIKNKTTVRLKEFPCINEGKFLYGAEEYGMQYMAAILKNTSTYIPDRFKETLCTEEKMPDRRFVPGSEWVYVKLYCGIHEADRLIKTVVHDTVSNFRSSGLIDKWFFLRYSDPDFHLRIRLHVANKENVASIISQLCNILQVYVGDFRVWKLQFDTYDREIERYGGSTIEIAESYFSSDSDAVTGLLRYNDGQIDPTTRTIWLLKAIDDLLTIYRMSLDLRFKLMVQLRNSFANELNAGKVTNSQIDTKFRKIKNLIEKALSGDRSMFDGIFFDLLDKRKGEMIYQAEQIINIHKEGKRTVGVDNMLSGFIHMTCNRVFTTHARQQEFIIYDFLSRYYRSRLAILGKVQVNIGNQG
jgi:thiopeptide-type bacteriocin biosynthesis protein